MHQSHFSSPSLALEQFVRFYVQRETCIQGRPVVHPVPARPMPMMVFDFRDPTDVFHYKQQSILRSPSAVLVGPQTYRRVEMQLRGTIDTFAISFQPDGMHRLFSIPMQELTDSDFEAHSVLGSFITNLAERLGNSRSFAERVILVEEAFLPRALALDRCDGVSTAANRIIQAGGRADISGFANSAGLGVRQFERRFLQQVGMRPKLFARIARFEAALETKARFNAKSWTDVAHESGYYDQMHMVHDFAEFAGGTPTETLTQLENVFVEQIKSMRSGVASPADAGNARLVF